LEDVQPSDWAFNALQSLVERYGCIAGYSNRTYLGNKPINRYEFAAGLNACLEKINELIANNTNNAVKDDDLIQLQRLEAEFQKELQEVEKRVTNLEDRTGELQASQFSTTTRLFGQATFSVQGTNSPDVDLFPRDKIPERKGENNITFANSVQLSLATSFTGRDLLLTGLSSGNLGSSAPSLFTNMGRLGFESDTSNDVVLSELSYRFPVSDNLGIVVGTAGVNAINTFRGINPLEGSGDGAISLFGQRNPILGIGNGTGGVGFDWQISPRISLQGVYSSEIPSFPSNKSLAGLFGGRYTTGVQLSLAPTNNIDVGLNYLYSHSPDGLLGNGIGDSQLISPFADPTAFNTHAVGATVAWRINPNVHLGGWGGWTYSKPENLSGSVETTNWMVFAAFPNLFRPGNLGGVMVGQPPKITSSNLPEEFNFPNFSDGGTEGGRRDSSLHLELFYRAQLNENLALTPGLFVILNPDHNSANDALVVGSLRATFRF
jgi:Carbohydrate-selective porin, OprB family/S-layer homology domain